MNNSDQVNPAHWSRLERALAAVKAHPEHHDQRTWHCGTSHCIAGFAELQLVEATSDELLEDLLENNWRSPALSPAITPSYFGITPLAYNQIISRDNTLADLEFFVHRIIEKGGYAVSAS